MDDYLKFQEVLKEELLDNYNKWGVTQYYIVDDTFNDSTEKLLKVKEVLDSLPFKINFWCYLRLDLLAKHPEQIPLLKEMGISQTYFGIETFHPGASKAVGKGMSAEKRKAALAQCKEIWGDDVHIQSGFMVGLPHEPEESIQETAAYLRDPECPIHQAWIFPVNMWNTRNDQPALKYIYKSDFDLNFDKHGYYFDEPWTYQNCTKWMKDDNTGIPNSDEAARIAGKWDTTVPKKLYTADFYKSSLNHPVLSNRKETKKMTQEEYLNLLESLDLEKLFYKTVTEQYFAPLLEKLRKLN